MDATEELIERFQDPAAWDHVQDGVPIFTEHECWEVEQADGSTALRMILPGQPRPEAGRMLYAVDAEKVQATADEINRNLNDYRKPIKAFIGHSSPTRRQEDNPDVIGYGVGAEVRKWGPKGAATIFSRLFYKPGTFAEARKYPERSPEFFPGRNVITGLALLKTDPRLPMGMMPYGADEFVVHYGQGFDAMDPKEKDDEKDPTEIPVDDKPEGDETGEGAPDSETPDEPGDDLELSPDEAKSAMRYMAHYEKHHPVIRYACEQFRKYQATAPTGTNAMPQPAGGAPEEERKDMANTDTQVNYAEEIKSLRDEVATIKASNTELQVRYANSESARLVQGLLNEGYRIKEPKKMLERMAKLDDAGRADLAAEIRTNYAQEERPPVSPFADFITATETPNGPGGTGKRELSQEDVDRVVAYAEEHKVDIGSEAGWENAVKAVFSQSTK